MNTIKKNPFERKQKGAMSALCVVCLLLAGSLNSCGKKADLGGEVPYKPCTCDEGKSMQPILNGDGDHGVMQIEAYLFNGYPSDEVLAKAFPEKDLKPLKPPSSYPVFFFLHFIVFDSENDYAWIKTSGPMHASAVRICNFPDFAKEWDIPEEGLKVYFAGSFYESCEYKPYDAFGVGDEDLFIYFTSDFLLTHLKRR